MVYLAHHGIKGQKWGVRRFQNADGSLTEAGKQRYDTGKDRQLMEIKSKTQKGEIVSMGERPTPKFASFISKFFPGIKDNILKDSQFNITVDGKRIGDLEIFKERPDSLNVVWVGIDSSQRGRGYATAVMNGVVEYAKKAGMKQITLEVPGNSPDARHIYEKIGFKPTKILTTKDEDPVWGGLTQMIKKL